MTKKNDLDLTDDEKAVLRSNRTPESVRDLLARRHDSIGVETSAFRKAAAVMAAEADMLIAARMLRGERDELATAADWKAEAELRQRKLDAIEARATELEQVVAEKDAQHLRQIAAPAMAVSGD